MNLPLTACATSVWIVEDHPVFAKHLSRLISAADDLECSRHFETAEAFFECLRMTTERPDVVLLDLGLPGRDGLEVLSQLREREPTLKVLILSGYDDRERVYRAICNGASGYLLKTSNPEEILSGIREVVHGAAALSSKITSMILKGFSKHGPVEELEALTKREEQVLGGLVKGFIKKEIADQLAISSHTVDMHLRSIYRKLHVSTQTEAVAKGLRLGLV
jgi:DNA-binding NarL/FixJ family response regulator